MLGSIKGRLKDRTPVKIFNMEVYQWLPKSDILVGLIMSTLLINVLSLVFPLSLLQIYDRIIPYQATSTLFYLMLAVCIAMILEMFIKLGRAYVSAWGDARLGYKSSNKAFEYLLNAHLSAYEGVGSGVHLDRLNALNRVKDFYGGQAITTLLDIPFVFIFLLLIAFIEPILIIVPLSIQGGILYISYKYGPTVFETLKKRSQTNEKKINYIVEVLGGIHTIKSQGMEQLMLRRYERLQNSSAFDDFEFAQKNAAHNRMGTLLSQINLVGVVFVGAFLVLHQQLTPGGVAACIMLSSRCMMPFIKAMNLWSRFQAIKLAEEKYQAILALPQRKILTSKTDVLTRTDIVFDNITYGYNKGKKPILEHANLTIKDGEMISLQCDGAQGKSSALLLIKGLLTPFTGEIRIGGTPLSDYSQNVLGRDMAYLPQEGVLFEGTILENLTLFRDGEYVLKAKALSEALELDAFIEQMPQGYQTMLGQGSVDFVSKGIKQRILIVRALIDEPKIILFDEANSAMDIASDNKLKELLQSYHGEKTMIIVSHRPSFVNMADRKVIIKDFNFKEVSDDQ